MKGTKNMVTVKDVVREQLQFSQMLLEKMTADLTDPEYLMPAIDNGNHATWILGHIAHAEDWATSLLTGNAQNLSAAVHELYQGGSTCTTDASRYPSRAEIDDMFKTTRARTFNALEGFDEGRWGDDAPEGAPIDSFPKVGSLWGLLGFHPFWHIGQLTDCRKVLGKPPALS